MLVGAVQLSATLVFPKAPDGVPGAVGTIAVTLAEATLFVVHLPPALVAVTA